MRTLAVLLTLICIAPAGLAQPEMDLEAVRVEVTWVSDSAELAAVRKRYEPKRERLRRGIGEQHQRGRGVRGFSVLGKRDGEYVCLVFAERPEQKDGKRAEILKHELLHCLWGAYHD